MPLKIASKKLISEGALLLAVTLLSAAFLAHTIEAQHTNPRTNSTPVENAPASTIPAENADRKCPGPACPEIPLGTILPIRLNSTLSSSKTKPGQLITATIMQNVPLSTGGKIRRGTRVLGHIVEVSGGTSPARISLQFDKLDIPNHAARITTSLRAIAGFVDVHEAQTPTIPAGMGDNYYQLPTVQVGGDVVYGWGGPVTRSDDSSIVVGKAVADGVLSKVSAKEGMKCRGALYGNDSPQALWVFSSDACGVYAIDDLKIDHAGRTSPEGLIVLSSYAGKVLIRSGAGMLLRINNVGD